MVIGMDLLEQFSPMQVDWQGKWLSIPYGGDFQLLQGELACLLVGSVVQVSAVLSDDTLARQETVPPRVAELLDEFQVIFAPPNSYPQPSSLITLFL